MPNRMTQRKKSSSCIMRSPYVSCSACGSGSFLISSATKPRMRSTHLAVTFTCGKSVCITPISKSKSPIRFTTKPVIRYLTTICLSTFSRTERSQCRSSLKGIDCWRLRQTSTWRTSLRRLWSGSETSQTVTRRRQLIGESENDFEYF